MSFQIQDKYFEEIVEHYKKFTLLSKRNDIDLEAGLSSLRISSEKVSKPNTTALQRATLQNEQDKLLMAMRKLREGIIASKRADRFAVEVYVFCIRAGILAKHMESYHPALLHLLQVLYPKVQVSESEHQEFAGYLILDLACRQANYAAGFRASQVYGLQGTKANAVLRTLVHGQYHLFWRINNAASEYEAKIMEYAEDRMRALALRCLERAYFKVDEIYLTRVTAMNLKGLRTVYDLRWEYDGQSIVIRRQKTK